MLFKIFNFIAGHDHYVGEYKMLAVLLIILAFIGILDYFTTFGARTKLEKFGHRGSFGLLVFSFLVLMA